MAATLAKKVMEVVAASCTCPAHSHAFGGLRSMAASPAGATFDYAYEMATSSVRVGRGVTAVFSCSALLVIVHRKLDMILSICKQQKCVSSQIRK